MGSNEALGRAAGILFTEAHYHARVPGRGLVHSRGVAVVARDF